MYISESATQGQPVRIYPFLWMADVSSNPNAETMQLLEAYGMCDPVKVEARHWAVVVMWEAVLHHTGKGYCHLPVPLCAASPYCEADEDGRQLLSHQHNVEVQDICTYLGVGINYKELC
jgi:hypothetical protein